MDMLITRREDVAGIFLPVIDEIERLVQDQILQVSIAGMQPKVSGHGQVALTFGAPYDRS